jgi:hypothetical protein
LAGTNTTSLPIPQAQNSFPSRLSLSFSKAGRFQSNWRWYVPLPSV